MRLWVFLIISLVLIPRLALAQPSLLPPCIHSGNCGICDIIDVVSRATQFLLYFLGIGIFLVFVVGAGWFFIWGRGNPDKVQRGKDMMWGSLYGGLMVLIAWQLVNLVLFAVGTQSGREMYETGDADSVGMTPEKEDRSITFKVFDNPWNYICDPEYGALANLAKNPAGGYNQAVCFSRGDGTPCEGKKEDGEEKAWGLCIGGVCCGGEIGNRCPGKVNYEHEFACDYLAKNYKSYFGTEGARGLAGFTGEWVDYRCRTQDEIKEKEEGLKDDKTKSVDCFPLEDNLCGSGGKQCCGLVAEASPPY